MKKEKFTKKYINSLPFEDSGQKLYWDIELKGFGIRVGKDTKTYIVQKDIKGKSERESIGKHDIYPCSTARDRAKKLLLIMAEGISPSKEKKRFKLQRLTLNDSFNNYINKRQSKLKERTIEGYKDYIENHLADWLKKDMKDIDRNMIEDRFNKITLGSGSYAANNTMSFLGSLYNFAAIDDADIKNPVDVLTLKKLRNKKIRRDAFIRDHQISDWYKAVKTLNNASFRDALLLIFFTGLRKMEAFRMRWEDIDFKDKSFHIPDTKNSTPLYLPMNSFVIDLLQERQEISGSGKWVFPGNGKAGHIVDAKSSIKNVKAVSGVKFIVHDLRRTYATKARKLSIPQETIKRLLNHAKSNDVTEGYIITDTDDLREPCQQISDAFMKLI